MKTSLFLLILTGQCFVATCHLYKYRFIKEKKSWHEAQSYCKEHHTDLATVLDMTDQQRLREKGKPRSGWIGLRGSQGEKMWHWSSGLEFNNSTTKWKKGEPNDKSQQENCVAIRDNEWLDFQCDNPKTFICYNETLTGPERFKHINESKTWTQAQNYCREHHTDLVSEPDQLNTSNDGITRWIGLFRDSWRWSDGSDSGFRHWEQQQFVAGSDEKCAVVLKESGHWKPLSCSEKKRFFCYDDKLVLVKENLTWEDALYHCRENYTDLVTITRAPEQRLVQAKAKDASTSHVWLGLRYTCTLGFWFWVSGKMVRYDNWAPSREIDDCDMSGAMGKDGGHKWFKKQDEEKFNFFCSK